MEDKVGKETLEAIGAANKFNRWMYDSIKPYSKEMVLEIGSGIGNISRQFLKDNFNLMLSDHNPLYCEHLKVHFADYPNFMGIRQMDLVDPEFDEKFADLFEKFDTVFALNVIEHIENDLLALANCRKLLKKDGHLIILVPSYQQLYNTFDIELGHYRRYNVAAMSKLFKTNHFDLVHTQYFNFIGILGWYFNGNILRKSQLPAGQMKIYDTLVPVFKIFDKLFQNKIGLSTIVVGKKAI